MNPLNKLFLNDPKAFKNVILTPFQRDIYNTVVEHNVTTSVKLIECSDLPESTARLQLRILCDKGYLKRELIYHNRKQGRSSYKYEVI